MLRIIIFGALVMLGSVSSPASELVIGPVGASAEPAFGRVLRPPAVVLAHLDALKRVAFVKDLPPEIQAGDFDPSRPGASWALAEPGARWNATDAILDPTLPRRRLIFAGCDIKVCVVYYELGGRGEYNRVLAIAQSDHRWQAVWSAVGFESRADLDAVRGLLRNQGPLSYDDSGRYGGEL